MQQFSAYGVSLVSLSVNSDVSGSVTIASTWDNAVKVVQIDGQTDVSVYAVSDNAEGSSVYLQSASAIVNYAELRSHAFVASKVKTA